MPNVTTITTIDGLSRLVEARFKDDRLTTVLYRGHGAASFRLLPKVGRLRPSPNSTSKTVNEPLMLELFRRQSPDRVSITAADDWELLAIAQHHGMATRLLDWTRSPLVALFFAVNIQHETRYSSRRPKREPAEIIAWRCRKRDLTEPLPECGPLKMEKSVRYIRYLPRIVTPRLRAQSGVFTVHSTPNEEFRPDAGDGEIFRIRIPFTKRRELKRSLFRHGIHEGVIFPDLDGLARHIEWCQTKSY